MIQHKKIRDVISVFIEIPKGSRYKYEYDERKRIFQLDRIISVRYPVDYGNIQKTVSNDGDPLDAIVLSRIPTFSGKVIKARILGVLMMTDEGKRDDKIVCAPVQGNNNLASVKKTTLKKIAHFFATYKKREGKEVKILGWKGKEEAKKIILASIERYKKNKNGNSHSSKI
ncbi:inorganic diphosphatase [Candidatus Woesearchaeota archaeon]|nr:inorganic diphosphatase [Candidatus Woesearchaeota archaeon]